jgi:hypothetical protein
MMAAKIPWAGRASRHDEPPLAFYGCNSLYKMEFICFKTARPIS